MWIDRKAAPARVGLNITSMLTLGALRIPIANKVPVTADGTWIGNFQTWSFILAGLSTFEYVLVNFSPSSPPVPRS